MFDHLTSQLGHSVQRLLQRPNPWRESVPCAQARNQQRQRARLMKHDLYYLLEQHPAARQLVRHLDVVERSLRRGGLDALEALPVRVIAKALAEFERLVWDWSPVGLADLRSRMAMIVKAQPRAAEAEPRSAPATDRRAPEIASQADVTEVEVDHSVFEEMERSWVGHAPARSVAA